MCPLRRSCWNDEPSVLALIRQRARPNTRGATASGADSQHKYHWSERPVRLVSWIIELPRRCLSLPDRSPDATGLPDPTVPLCLRHATPLPRGVELAFGTFASPRPAGFSALLVGRSTLPVQRCCKDIYLRPYVRYSCGATTPRNRIFDGRGRRRA